MGVKKVVQKGQTILVADYRGLQKADQQIQVLEELTKILGSLGFCVVPPISGGWYNWCKRMRRW